MNIGGLEKFSLVDYPGKIAAIVFTKGCNFRCRFCYNPMLVLLGQEEIGRLRSLKPEETQILETVDGFFAFLKKRQGYLEAVVVTGGEPTLHEDLPEFLAKIKALGYFIKLDTNGSNPEMLKKVLAENLVDYLAMDLKAPFPKYWEVAGVNSEPLFKKIKESVKILIQSGLPYEFRTTVVPELLGKGDIIAMGKIIRGADTWHLQRFRSDTALVDPNFRGKKPYHINQMDELVLIGKKFVKHCAWR